MQKKAPICDKPWAAFGGHKLASRGLGPNGPDALRGLVLSKAVCKRTGVTCRRPADVGVTISDETFGAGEGPVLIKSVRLLLVTISDETFGAGEGPVLIKSVRLSLS